MVGRAVAENPTKCIFVGLWGLLLRFYLDQP
jgi:hypothetical protein